MTLISWTSAAAAYRSAPSIEYGLMLVQAALGGLVVAGIIAVVLVRFPGRIRGAGFVTAQLFFSAWLFPLGWLVLRCGFLPRLLGWLLLLDGVAVVAWFLQTLLAPDYGAISYPAWAVGFVAEVSLAIWLVVKGDRPRSRP